MEGHRIEMEHHYPHPIDRVWRAISDQDAISKWFIQADFLAQAGYHYTFTHEATTVTGQVLEVEPPTRLVYTWIVGKTTARTVVEWLLTPTETGTKLRIVHEGFENYADSAASMFTSSVKGWQAVINELAAYLDG